MVAQFELVSEVRLGRAGVQEVIGIVLPRHVTARNDLFIFSGFFFDFEHLTQAEFLV